MNDDVERAFEYRGYVTIRRRDGTSLIGYVYDRDARSVGVLDETATVRTRLSRDEIAAIELSGDDPVRKAQEIWERRKGTLEPRATPAWGGWEPDRPVLYVVALGRELRHAARALGLVARGDVARGAREVVHAIGPGGGAARVVAAEEPRAVVSCGFCGALDGELRPGDLVLATSVRDEGGSSVDAHPAALAAARDALRALRASRVREGPLLCTTRVIAGPAEKRALGASGAIAVDMETHPVARAAGRAAVPWLALRAVVDARDDALPAFVGEDRRGQTALALLHALSGPRAAQQIARLAHGALHAGRALEEGLRALAPALAALPAPPLSHDGARP